MKVKLKVNFVIIEREFDRETKLYEIRRKTIPKGTVFEVMVYDKNPHFHNNDLVAGILLNNEERELWLSLQEFSILTEEV